MRQKILFCSRSTPAHPNRCPSHWKCATPFGQIRPVRRWSSETRNFKFWLYLCYVFREKPNCAKRRSFSLGAGRAKHTISSHRHKIIDKRNLTSFRSLRHRNVLNRACTLEVISCYVLREKRNGAKWCVDLTPPWFRSRSTPVVRNADAVLIASPA